MARRVLKEVKLTVSEVLDILTEEEGGGQFQTRTIEYSRKVSKVDGETARRLVDELLKLGDITEEEAVQIVNVMPETKEELKASFYHRRTILMEEFLEKVLKVLKSESSPQVDE